MTTSCELKTIQMSAVAPEAIEWLWPGRIPIGKVTLIMGNPGQGKGLMTIDLAARLTTGEPWPGETESRKPGSVLLLTPEDDPADTIRPRLDVAGADTDRVHLVEAVHPNNDPSGERSFQLEADVERLAAKVKELSDCGLIIIDPISAYFGTNLDSHKDTDVRKLMMPLVKLAADYHVAIICVSHMNKGQTTAINRGMGSMAFTAVARTVWMIAKCPDDHEVRLLAPVKSNIGKDSLGAAFRVLEFDHAILKTPQPAIEWIDDDFTMTADDLLAMADSPDRVGKKEEAEEFLREVLADGKVRKSEVSQKASERGITQTTLNRAKGSLGIQCSKEAGIAKGPWWWSLPVPEESVPKPG